MRTQWAWKPSDSETYFIVMGSEDAAREAADERNRAAEEAASELTARLRRAEATLAREQKRQPRDIAAVMPTTYSVYSRTAPTDWIGGTS